MTFLQQFSTDFNSIATKVKEITDSENTFLIEPGSPDYEKALDIKNYSSYGLKSLGSYIGFPAQFVANLADSDTELAQNIIKNRMENYFFTNKFPAFYGREFINTIQGVVSKNYAYFDDDEVIDILSESPIKDLPFEKTIITPERLHLRAIDNDSFRIEDDDSNLFFVFFIDNSMVGQSSFRVRLGIFRQACSNGLIISTSEFVMCRQVHKGTKNISDEFNASLAFLTDKKEAIQKMIVDSACTPSQIEEMRAEYRADYLAKKLILNKKEAEKILKLYITYGGKTKWAMTNAITEFARDIKDITRRTALESKALVVA